MKQGNSSTAAIVAIISILAIALLTFISMKMIRDESQNEQETETSPGTIIEIDGGASMSDLFVE